MTKSLLISIRPQHLLNILNGDKTYEVRKVVPKWVLDKLDRGETVEAYLYCTKGKPYLINKDMLSEYYELRNVYTQNFTYEILNGTIPVKVVIDGYDEVLTQHHIDGEQIDRVLKYACIEREDFDKYIGDKEMAYALHISKLEILDEPKTLMQFYEPNIDVQCGLNGDIKDEEYVRCLEERRLTKAPQNCMSVWVK